VTTTTATGIEALSADYVARLAERTPKSHALRQQAELVLSGGVSSHFKAWQPFYVAKAEGSHLTDVDGNDYVDLVMGFGPNSLGHSPRVVMDAVRAVLDHGTSLAVGTPLEVELAQAIARLVPSMEQMRFVVTGTEATMMALRTARAFTRRTRVARFEGHYHGQHDGALASVAHVGGSEERPQPVADGAGIPQAVLDDVVVLPWNDIDKVAPVVREAVDDLAAIILEPVPFSNIGGVEPDPEFLRALRELTAQHGTLCILGYHARGPRELDLNWWYKGISVVHGFTQQRWRHQRAMATGMDLIRTHQFSYAPLITHRFDLSGVDAAFACFTDRPAGFVKSVIIP